LDALINRKRRLLNPQDALRRHPKAALALAGTSALLIASGIGFVAYRSSTRKDRAHRENWTAWARVVAHPESVSPSLSGFLLVMLQKCASASLAATIAAVAKHYVVRLLEERPHSVGRVHGPRAERDPFPSPPLVR
jgi:hypothetical protein